MPKPTLIDVGLEAGVSAITVSRALRSPDKVSDSMRKRVNAAVEKLGYVPNRAASTLASNATNSVVIMIPSVSNNVFTDVLRGIEDTLKGTQFTIQIGNTGYDPLEEERLLRSFLNPKPTGVILSGLEQTEATKKMLVDLEVPVVQIMDVDPDPINKIVGFSHSDAARAAVDHMLNQGFKNIGFLGAQMDPRSQKRLTGYRAALDQAGLSYDRNIAVTNQPSSVQLGAMLFSNLVKSFPECDAVFCNNDDLALGVLFECERRGLKVPRDMGICGFNDLGITSETCPKVTSVATPLREIGETAGKLLISGEGNPQVDCIDLGYKLMARESTVGRGKS